MRDLGFTPTASYSGALQTNLQGGPYEVWAYAGQLSASLNADLERLAGLHGWSFYVGASWGTGSNMAATLQSPIGTSSLYAPSYYLGEMYLEGVFIKDRLTLDVGRLAASTGFATLPVFANYVTAGVNPNPFALSGNDPAFSGPPPGSEWGAQASFRVSSAVQISAGIFNTNLNSANGAKHGTDFTLQEGNRGMLLVTELRYQYGGSQPGEFSIGYLHNDNSLPDLEHPEMTSGGYSGVYVTGQKMIFQPDPTAPSRGLTAWGTVTASSNARVSAVPLFWATGLSFEGPFSARMADIVSGIVMHGEGSGHARPSETVVEINYQWTHSRYLSLTPHVQYLSDAVGHAWVLGVQAGLVL